GLFLHLFGEGIGWRLAFLFTALPGLLLALLMRRVAEAPGESGESGEGLGTTQGPAPDNTWQQPPSGLRANLRHEAVRINQVLHIRTVWLVILLQALMFSVVTPTVTFLPIYVRSAGGPFHLNATQTSLLTGGTVVLGGLAGTVLGGNIADWL